MDATVECGMYTEKVRHGSTGHEDCRVDRDTRVDLVWTDFFFPNGGL